MDAGEGFEMSVGGDGAAFPPNAGGPQQAQGKAPRGSAGDPKRARSPLGVRVDDIKWTLIPAWLALFILAIWTGAWMFSFVLGLGVALFAVARLGFVRSLPEPPTAAPVVVTSAAAQARAAVETVVQAASAPSRPEIGPADLIRRLPDPAILTDHTGRIVAGNDALEQVFGIVEPRKHLGERHSRAAGFGRARSGACRAWRAAGRVFDRRYAGADVRMLRDADRGRGPGVAGGLDRAARSDEGAARRADARRLRRQCQP